MFYKSDKLNDPIQCSFYRNDRFFSETSDGESEDILFQFIWK